MSDANKKKDIGGYAFPSHFSVGMTIRDYFAAEAIRGLMTEYWNKDSFTGPTFDSISKSAYALADAMLIERNK